MNERFSFSTMHLLLLLLLHLRYLRSNGPHWKSCLLLIALLSLSTRQLALARVRGGAGTSSVIASFLFFLFSPTP